MLNETFLSRKAMKAWPVKSIRPSAIICSSIFLVLVLFPDRCLVEGGKGKKPIAPVRHLFGVGIGYQRIVHYKPVLVFSKHRRPKLKRRPGWGRGRPRKGWTPVVVQHHIYKHEHDHHHRHGYDRSHRRHPKRRPKLHHHHRHGGYQSYPGWGWKPLRRKPHYKPHTSNLDSSYDHPSGRFVHHAPSTDDDYIGGSIDWSPGGGRGYAPLVPDSVLDYVDDHGYETELKEHWNKHANKPLNPLVFPESTVSSGDKASSSLSHSPYPFSDAPKSDKSVTNMRRDFLRNHLKNYREFQGYQEAHNHNEPGDHSFSPMKPPGPNYSTTHGHGPEVADAPYYDDYPNDDSNQAEKSNSPPETYNYDVIDEDGFNWTELNRKMTTTRKPLIIRNSMHSQSPIVYGTPAALASDQHNVVLNAPVQTNIQVNTTPMPDNSKKFKPSPKIDDLGSGAAFTHPGFFPTFQEFQNINIDK